MGRGHAGQMRGASGPGDDHLDPAGLGLLCEPRHSIGRAVGRDDLRLVWHVEPAQHFRRVGHGLPIGLAAHDHRNQRIRSNTYRHHWEFTRMTRFLGRNRLPRRGYELGVGL